MIKCEAKDCKVNHEGKCYSGNGNLKAINSSSKHPDECNWVDSSKRKTVTLVMTFGKDAKMYWR